MQKKRPRTLLISLALAGLAAQASAIGFGPVSTSATLGQALNHVINLRLDPGEFVAVECVSAEVTVGDQRLPASAVRTRLEGEGNNLQMRVSTSAAIDEPVVSVSVAVGCPPRLSRRFVLFADPASPIAPSAPLTLPVPADAAPAMADARPMAVAPAAEPRPAASRPPARVAAAPRVRTPRQPASARRNTTTKAPLAPSVATRPRLKLEVAEQPPTARQQATLDVVEAAASAAATLAAAQAGAQATSAAAGSIAALEKSIEKLRADSAADRASLLALRQRAASSDVQAAWMPWLAGLVALLAVLAAWLALQLRRLQAEREKLWWNASVAAPEATKAPMAERRTEPGGIEPTTAGPVSAGYSTTRPGTLGPVFAAELPLSEPITEQPVMPMERTQALPVGWREEPLGQRDVSIEELIDLEQQAEFFIVLGQEDAAIDLLVDHLRSTGGGSPMPYLKLLEIYRRRGDREAYDRTRARFNHRFNAYAPDWDVDTQVGRLLEDYPGIVARLQMAWPSPIDAMAELESLLFRKARGELFDMPAYRDVLFLYSLARDLLDREPVDAGNVDVLLPINEGGEYTQPMSLDEAPNSVDSGLVPLDNQPTVPVDLDVTQPSIPESLFGEPTEPGIGSRRRR